MHIYYRKNYCIFLIVIGLNCQAVNASNYANYKKLMAVNVQLGSNIIDLEYKNFDKNDFRYLYQTIPEKS